MELGAKYPEMFDRLNVSNTRNNQKAFKSITGGS